MDPTNLIEMVNRIGEFFAAMPDRREALDGIATHVRKFWAPRMRRQLFVQIDRGEATELAPLVREAILAHRDALEPRDVGA
ncbi:MAG: formate dehydrogenase subunit delta [Myxococcota bacterium]